MLQHCIMLVCFDFDLNNLWHSGVNVPWQSKKESYITLDFMMQLSILLSACPKEPQGTPRNFKEPKVILIPKSYQYFSLDARQKNANQSCFAIKYRKHGSSSFSHTFNSGCYFGFHSGKKCEFQIEWGWVRSLALVIYIINYLLINFVMYIN